MPKGIFIRTEKHKRNIGLAQMGEKHHNWKGDDVGYKGLHDWISRNYGKPMICWYCKSKDAKKYEWANISGKYRRDKDDWMRLCASCHDLFERNLLKQEEIKDWLEKLH